MEDWDSMSHVQGPLRSSAYEESEMPGIEAERQDLNAHGSVSLIH